MEDAFRETRLARVVAIQQAAIDVLRFDLVPADGRSFDSFTPGSHIDVFVPTGQVRQYSLCGDSLDSRRYTIAVKKEDAGRGGSLGMHRNVEVGSAIAFAGPRNFFPLSAEAHRERNLFIAGGIGITPICSMLRWLSAKASSWELHYCARSAAHAAFYDEILSLHGGRVTPYFSEAPLLDVQELLRTVSGDAHLYCCGPEGLMKAVAHATSHWPEGRVHFEWFSAPTAEWAPNQPFEVFLKASGCVLQVPADRSILQVVRAHGIDVPSACEEGVCGTCETRVLEGEPEHRDVLLSAAEKAANHSMMICVSRARSAKLVLDL
jgi:ferredoxin-NADP reductase